MESNGAEGIDQLIAAIRLAAAWSLAMHATKFKANLFIPTYVTCVSQKLINMVIVTDTTRRWEFFNRTLRDSFDEAHYCVPGANHSALQTF